MRSKLSEQAVKEKLSAFRGWELADGKLRRTYSFGDFMAAVELVNKVAVAAEHLDHHPDILIQYNKVTFMLATHDAGGVTDRDFQLARNIDQLATMAI